MTRLLLQRRGESIFHFARFDLALLCQVLGSSTVLALTDRVVCTKIAARVAGYGDGKAKLADVLYEAFGSRLDKSPAIRQSVWSVRPLSQAQVDYALADVRQLPALWDEVLLPRLQESGQLEWARECFRVAVAIAIKDATGEDVGDRRVHETLSRAERMGVLHLFEY